MKFGIFLPVFGGWLRRSANEKEREPSYDYVKETAVKAEEIGIDSLWIPDHLLNPPKGEEAPSLEAWTLATAIAEVTEEVDISHTTICEGFRYPAVLAKQASTLQEICEGRFWLSIGAGWFKREYEAFGLEFLEHDERIEKAYETIEIVERLWREKRVDYDGDYYQINKGIVEPKPDPVPPIWYAGMSEPSRELVAEKADGWLMGADEVSEVESHIEDMKQRLKEKDREPSEMEFALPAITILGDTDEEAEERLKEISNGEEKIYNRVAKTGLVGGFETVNKEMEKLEDLGIDHLLFQLTPTLDDLDRVKELVQDHNRESDIDMQIEEVESPTYTIDEDRYSRFDKRDTVFGRKMLDPHVDFYDKDMYEKVDQMLGEDKEGYSPVQFAQMMGAWTVYDYFHGAFSWEKLGNANNVMSKPLLDDFKVEDREEMSESIKQTAKIYGASLVGITEINKDWLYSHDYSGEEVDIPEEFEYAVVMAIGLDPQMVDQSPSFPAGIESGLGYSKMAFCIGCLAEFIRTLGYEAIPMGNDTALSIPLAIDAGLGELGRNGMLITPEYGPLVKLCKVFTDMPLAADKPISLGVEEFCKNCGRCAEACEADAIQPEKEPSFETINRSNNEGIKRWAVDHEKCYKFWIENGSDCSNCVKVCPFVDMEI